MGCGTGSMQGTNSMFDLVIIVLMGEGVSLRPSHVWLEEMGMFNSDGGR